MAEFVKPSTEEVFEMIDAAVNYDSAAMKGKEGIYQFDLEGDDGGKYQIIIEEVGAKAIKGVEKDPQVTLTIDHNNFRELVAGSLNPTAAFMGGKLKIKGNMGLAFKLQTILNSFSF
ncbi:SCP2 sterol-binding domain-containing protein [Virgibacillus siamensis]|uniref:SCP2 sterol-binding domain-containing protein n=1 Tax=Virgibacillus siamensis TaxID=480071 RepID=UPI000986B682|nr:SCP2 sterol-binding domain-containing protein [Virgibacillus siamensis]